MFWLLMQFQHSKRTLEIIRVDFYDYGFLWHIMLFLWAIFFQSTLIHYIGSKLRDGGQGRRDTRHSQSSLIFFLMEEIRVGRAGWGEGICLSPPPPKFSQLLLMKSLLGIILLSYFKFEKDLISKTKILITGKRMTVL